MIKYNFFGKDCILDRALKNRSDLTSKLDLLGFKHDHLLMLNQIHSNEIIVIDEEKKIYGDQNLPKVDGIITNLKNITIAIVTADCGPIFLIDEEKEIIAAVHAGWRGAKSGIIKSAIFEMKKLGAKNISAIIGPMIHQDSYEISQDFFDEFLSEKESNKIFFKNGVSADKYLFDLPSYIEEKLRNEGVEKIKNVMIDTYKSEEKFFSFRRSTHRKEADCGRNVSAIVIN